MGCVTEMPLICVYHGITHAKNSSGLNWSKYYNGNLYQQSKIIFLDTKNPETWGFLHGAGDT